MTTTDCFENVIPRILWPIKDLARDVRTVRVTDALVDFFTHADVHCSHADVHCSHADVHCSHADVHCSPKDRSHDRRGGKTYDVILDVFDRARLADDLESLRPGGAMILDCAPVDEDLDAVAGIHDATCSIVDLSFLDHAQVLAVFVKSSSSSMSSTLL